MEQLNIIRNNCLEQLKIIDSEIERLNNENWEKTSMNFTYTCGFTTGFKSGYKKPLFTGNINLPINNSPMADEVLEALVTNTQLVPNKTDIIWLSLAKIICRELMAHAVGSTAVYLEERLKLMTVNARLYIDAIKNKDIKAIYADFDCALQLMKVFELDLDNYRGDLNAIEIIKNAGVDVTPFSMFFERIIDDLAAKLIGLPDAILLELIQKNLLDTSKKTA